VAITHKRKETKVMSKIDPIYAAVQKYREASAQLVALGEERDAEQESRLLKAMADAAREFAVTVPTTPAGAVDAVRFVCECYEEGDTILDTYLSEGRDVMCRFFASLHKAMEEWFIAARAAA
jgi:hypothetical protein